MKAISVLKLNLKYGKIFLKQEFFSESMTYVDKRTNGQTKLNVKGHTLYGSNF